MIPLTQYDRVIFSSSHTSNSVVCVCDVQLCHFLFFVSPLSGWWFFFLFSFSFLFTLWFQIIYFSTLFPLVRCILAWSLCVCHAIASYNGAFLCVRTLFASARALFGFSCAHSSTRGADNQSTSPSMEKKIRPLALITHRVARCIYRHWTLYFIWTV